MELGLYRNVPEPYGQPVFRSIGFDRPKCYLITDIKILVNKLEWGYQCRITAANKIRQWWKMKLAMRNTH